MRYAIPQSIKTMNIEYKDIFFFLRREKWNDPSLKFGVRPEIFWLSLSIIQDSTLIQYFQLKGATREFKVLFS